LVENPHINLVSSNNVIQSTFLKTKMSSSRKTSGKGSGKNPGNVSQSTKGKEPKKGLELRFDFTRKYELQDPNFDQNSVPSIMLLHMIFNSLPESVVCERLYSIGFTHYTHTFVKAVLASFFRPTPKMTIKKGSRIQVNYDTSNFKDKGLDIEQELHKNRFLYGVKPGNEDDYCEEDYAFLKTTESGISNTKKKPRVIDDDTTDDDEESEVNTNDFIEDEDSDTNTDEDSDYVEESPLSDSSKKNEEECPPPYSGTDETAEELAERMHATLTIE
jgi:hypothetical protein